MTGYFPTFDAEWQVVSPAEAGFDAELVDEVRRHALANESRMDRDIDRALATGHFSEPMPDGEIIGQTRPRGGPSGMIPNGADTSRTLAGRFIAPRLGSAVQHLAFATSDIFRTAQALRANGFDALPMPGNYYDDVQARFGLPAAELEQMKQANLLYDEDAAGRYYQLYSKPYGDGFFFEIVQREAVYGGYGAANAPFRITALKRLLKPQEASLQ